MGSNYLFSNYQIFDLIENQKLAINKEIESIDSNRLLNTSTSDLADYLYNKLKFEVPILQKENIQASQSEIKIDVSNDPMHAIFNRNGPVYVNGTEITIEIPFEGDMDFFQIRPSSFTYSPPQAIINKNSIILQFSGINLEAEQLKENINRNVVEIEKWLSVLQNDVRDFNTGLRNIAVSRIDSRKNKILQNQNLVSSLGYLLKENLNSPKTYMAPNVKRKINPALPKASNQEYKPEPCLSNEDYEHILNVIDNMAHVMERSPSAFINMDEESLRTHFLVQLNGHYEGQATGETFNYSGKTDILIRTNDKNIFIAECKFWKGEKKYMETIDQILGYASWRDTKAAIVIFNKNKEMTNVIKTIKDSTIKHINCKREIFSIPKKETEFKYIFSHRDDKNREIYLAIKIYDIPQGS